MKVKQFKNKKNQFIIWGENDGTTFQSYKSTIANISNAGKLTLYSDWDYSHTTLKYLYAFLQDYFYLLNETYKKLLWELSESKNKKQYLQNLIDNKKIDYVVEV